MRQERNMSRYVAGTGFATLDRIYAPPLIRPVEALGGSCANVLVSLAMLGHRATPILRLGADANGTFLVDEMRRAGCVTSFVFQAVGEESPVTIEYVDVRHAQHSFSSTCPETFRHLPTYTPLAESNADHALGVIKSAAIFYVDRLSAITLHAMEVASEAGALVVFEPNSVKDVSLFQRAMPLVNILKVSEEKRSQIDSCLFQAPPWLVTTQGSRGLTLETSTGTTIMPAVEAPRVVDTCGAGDMVTTGLIDALMTARSSRYTLQIQDICSGLLAGQWLAALNCAFVGARGLFHAFDGLMIRSALGASPKWTLDVTGSNPYAGY